MSLRVASAIVGALVGLQFGTAEGGTAALEGALVNGDVNCDADIDLADAVYLLNWKFLGGPAPCPAAGTAELQAQVGELEAEIASTNEDLVSCQAGLVANQVQLNETVTTLNTTVNALLDREAELQATEGERDALQTQVLSLEQELADTQSTLQTVQGERDNFEAQAQELQQDLTDTQAAQQAVESERDTLQGQLDQTSQQLATTQGDLGACETARAQLTTDLAGCTDELSSASTTLGVCETDLANATADLAAASMDLTQAQADLATCSTDFSTATMSLASCETGFATASADLTQTQADLGAANARITDLESGEAIAQCLGRVDELEVPGCSDLDAANFDCVVNVDDGSCEYPGCTDSNALNFDPDANVDDGSCFFAGDIPGFMFIADNAQGYPEYEHDATGIVFVRLPGGSFNMGSPILDCGSAVWERPVHEVTLSPFLIAKFEVTEAQWDHVAGTGPSPTPNLPMQRISWEQSKAFCDAVGLDLPTEAQWEYACRAGTNTIFAYGNLLSSLFTANFNGKDLVCSYAEGDAYLQARAEVGSYAENAFGLHDMHGNLNEWCEDVWDPEFFSKPEATDRDPLSTSGDASIRVFRGGYHGSPSLNCRSAFRDDERVTAQQNNLGFRPAFWPLP